MYYGKGSTSYNRSVVLSDATILTVGAISTNPDSLVKSLFRSN